MKRFVVLVVLGVVFLVGCFDPPSVGVAPTSKAIEEASTYYEGDSASTGGGAMIDALPAFKESN